MYFSAIKPFPFEKLPGEIRNQIFELCIADAMSKSRRPNEQNTQSGIRILPPQRFNFISSHAIPRVLSGLQVSVLPGWTGPGRIKTLGIGPLPLLFVNKQIHDEVSSLVDSKVEEVIIGPYGLQYADEDPNVRWELAYAYLKNRPHLRKHAKNIKVFLPWLQRHLLGLYWKSMGHKSKHKSDKAYGLTVLPRLTECLKTFEALSNLKIFLVAEVSNPPDMEPLLELHDLCGSSTIVNIVEPQHQDYVRPVATSPVTVWSRAWDKCLLENRGVAID